MSFETTSLSEQGQARKRAMLGELQRELGRRRARRSAARGGAAVAAVALLGAGGVLYSVRTAPAPERAIGQAPEAGLRIVRVRNQPGIVDRLRIDDDRLLEALRSAGYQGGLVRTEGRVLTTGDLPAPADEDKAQGEMG
ncbi:MAG: hypothetical protein ACF8R7_15750 [Phycisphaerales bacterium JB039]